MYRWCPSSVKYWYCVKYRQQTSIPAFVTSRLAILAREIWPLDYDMFVLSSWFRLLNFSPLIYCLHVHHNHARYLVSAWPRKLQQFNLVGCLILAWEQGKVTQDNRIFGQEAISIISELCIAKYFWRAKAMLLFPNYWWVTRSLWHLETTNMPFHTDFLFFPSCEKSGVLFSL